MDYLEQITELNDQLASLQASLDYHQQGIVSSQQSIQAWTKNLPKLSAQSAIAAHQAAIVDHKQNVAKRTKQIAQVESLIAALMKDMAAYNAALTTATSKGLTGAAAEEAAKAEVERAKTRRNVITIVAIGALLVLATWLGWKYWKRKGK